MCHCVLLTGSEVGSGREFRGIHSSSHSRDRESSVRPQPRNQPKKPTTTSGQRHHRTANGNEAVVGVGTWEPTPSVSPSVIQSSPRRPSAPVPRTFHSQSRAGRERAMAEPIVSAGAAAPPPGAPSFSYLAVFSNCPLVAAVLAFAIAQSIKVLTTWYALLPLPLSFHSTRARPAGVRQDLSSLPDGICVCHCAGTRRTGGTRSSWWAPAGCRPRTRPPSPRSPSPSACRRASPARSSPPPPSSPPWLVPLPVPSPSLSRHPKRVDHLRCALDLIASLMILGNVVVIRGSK